MGTQPSAAERSQTVVVEIARQAWSKLTAGARVPSDMHSRAAMRALMPRTGLRPPLRPIAMATDRLVVMTEEPLSIVIGRQ
jgi:hypothetical protein